METITKDAGRGRPASQRLAGLARLAAVLAVLVGSVLALVQPALADGDQDKYSLYGVAAAVGASYGRTISPAGGGNDAWAQLGGTPGRAGGLLGYPDSNLFEDLGWHLQSMTMGSKSVSMASLESLPGAYSGVAGYATYGATLGALGLDKTGTGFFDIGRWVVGLTTLVMYTLAVGVDLLMTLPLQLLSWLNPFKFFYSAFASVSPELAQALVGGDPSGVSGPLKPVVTLVGNIYSLVSGVGWGLAIPLLLAFAVFSWALLGRAKGGSLFMGILVRLLFMAVGVPGLGLLYTGALDAAVQGGDTSTSTAQVVASRWVDFEGWATEKQLAVPAGATIRWDVERGAPADASWDDLSHTVLAINNSVAGGRYGSMLSHEGTDWESISATGPTSTWGSWMLGFNLLARYTAGDTVAPASYSSTVQSGISADKVEEWFTELRTGADKLGVEDLTGNGLVSEGSLTTTLDDGVVHFTSGSPGLSKLAMYNYLTSVFSAEKVDIYSPQAASSLITTPQHRAVMLSGDSLVFILNWLGAIVLLGSFVVIGIGYGMGTFMMVLRRSFRLLVGIPLATLGSIRSIALVVSSVAVMILGLFASMFLYMLVKQLLMVVPGMAQFAAQTLMPTAFAGVIPWGGMVTLSIFNVVVTILVLVFTVAALRVRKAVLDSLEQVVDGVVDKIMPAPLAQAAGLPAVQPAPPSQPSALARAGRGLAASGAAAGGLALGNHTAQRMLAAAGVPGSGAHGTAGAAGGAPGVSGGLPGGQAGGVAPDGKPGGEAARKVVGAAVTGAVKGGFKGAAGGAAGIAAGAAGGAAAEGGKTLAAEGGKAVAGKAADRVKGVVADAGSGGTGSPAPQGAPAVAGPVPAAGATQEAPGRGPTVAPEPPQRTANQAGAGGSPHGHRQVVGGPAAGGPEVPAAGPAALTAAQKRKLVAAQALGAGVSAAGQGLARGGVKSAVQQGVYGAAQGGVAGFQQVRGTPTAAAQRQRPPAVKPAKQPRRGQAAAAAKPAQTAAPRPKVARQAPPGPHGGRAVPRARPTGGPSAPAWVNSVDTATVSRQARKLVGR